MPLVAFVDYELLEQLEKVDKKTGNDSVFPEHEFLLSCLKIGLTIEDLKQLTYVDVMKILFVLFDGDNEKKNVQHKEILINY